MLTAVFIISGKPINTPSVGPQLPVAVEIVKHPGETNGKSTAVHAAVLAPDDVTLRTYPDVGNYDPEEVGRCMGLC